MGKLLFAFFTVSFLFIQCTNNKEKYETQISTEFEFSDIQIQSIVDSFITEYPNEKLYELYIDKLDPHYATLIMYAGNNSAIGYENYDKKQKPIIDINRKGKHIHIYSGLEKYISKIQPQNDSTLFVKYQGMQEGNYWIVTDSFSVYKIRKERAYPFMPLPWFIPMIPDNL